MTHTFQIYRLESDGTKTELERFEGDDYKRASDEVETLRADPNNQGKTILWRYIHEIGILGKDGKVEKKFETTDDHFNFLMDQRKNRTIWKKVQSWMFKKLYSVLDFRHTLRYACQRVVFGYDERVSWNVGDSMFDFLIHNVSKMSKNLHGCPNKYVERARKILNPDMDDEKIAESFKDDPNGTHEELEVGCALWKSKLDKIVEDCKLYIYYSNYGIQEEDDKNWVSPYDHKIPKLKNSSEIDYKELSNITSKILDDIFKAIRDDFECLWD